MQSPVFDVSSDATEFIGIVSAGTQISYMVDPGKHVFIVISKAADFLEADVKKGQDLLRDRHDSWRSRFSLYPIRNGAAGDRQYDSDEFREWSNKVRFV